MILRLVLWGAPDDSRAEKALSFLLRKAAARGTNTGFEVESAGKRFLAKSVSLANMGTGEGLDNYETLSSPFVLQGYCKRQNTIREVVPGDKCQEASNI